ncbi:hypothetical protein F4825DRAFT_449998 [Nemania diffusa]|nr:hypothetical protein F4825DRAFT_449998 [Nemania diffusa]
MSGIEAVGLVLGVIPLIISALEHHQDGKDAVSTWRRHVRVVQSLVRNLKTEQGKLYNTSLFKKLSRTCSLSWKSSLTPRLSLRGDEESIIGKLDFRVILSHVYAPALANLYPPSWAWKEVKLQVDISSDSQKGEFSLARRPSVEPAGGRRAPKRVGFSLGGSPQAINQQTVAHRLQEANNPIPLTPLAQPLPEVVTSKLCQALSIDNLGLNACVYVTDPSVHEHGRFGVSRIDDIGDSCEISFISIRDMMDTPSGWRRNNTPSLPQKLALASTIASGILQLHDTPWLSVVMTSDTLYLAKLDSNINFNRAYISRTAPEGPCCHNPACHGPCVYSTGVIVRAEGFGNELMCALFVLLIEVILWRAMDNILSERFAADVAGTSPSEIFDYTTERGFGIVQGLLSQVTMVGGQEYRNAVESCLKLAFGYPNLDLGKEELRQQIYGNIITPIEESCERSNTLIIARGGYEAKY